MNAHRHQWNGTICSQPQGWNCGAEASFRADFCAGGLPLCFPREVFKPVSPRFVIPDPTVIRAVREQPHLLNDQVLVLYGGRFGSQQGIVPGELEQALYGLYRVKGVLVDHSRTQHRLIVEPHSDCWAMFPRVKLARATVRAIPDVAYLKQIRAKTLAEIVDQALEEAASLKSDGWTPDHEKHLRHAKERLPQWLREAEEAWATRLPLQHEPRSVVPAAPFPSAMAEQLAKLKIATLPTSTKPLEIGVPATRPVTTPVDETQSAPAKLVLAPLAAETPPPPAQDTSPVEESGGTTVPAVPESAAPLSAAQSAVEVADAVEQAPLAIPEPRAHALLVERFDASLISALSVAFATKGLVILTGAPGAGKSWIASRLLDDATRERTVIVPVASTWRGREDLLGYVNPINGHFEPTEFTNFLCDAEEAWKRGDRRTRLVVFEEFNLSQPEHWLSELLVRLEYEPDQHADRTVVLGGSVIAGRPQRLCRVVLAPSLRFVATLNNDHTVKPLSPRVLDRAALIEVFSSGREALHRAGLKLAPQMVDLIEDLNELLEPRGAGFSVRSARSLQRALVTGQRTGLGPTRALDLVLAQEVLSRVRLLAGDPRDEQLLARLQVWSRKPGVRSPPRQCRTDYRMGRGHGRRS